MTTQTQSNPAQSPDARPVQAERTLRVRTSGEVAAERDGYRQALETEKMLRAADVRELRAALETILEGAAPKDRETWTLADVIQDHYRIARAALEGGAK